MTVAFEHLPGEESDISIWDNLLFNVSESGDISSGVLFCSENHFKRKKRLTRECASGINSDEISVVTFVFNPI